MCFPGFHIPPLLLLFLAVLWGAGSLYFFAAGMSELIQINHEMTEALTKGHTALVAEQTAPAQIHVGWRLVLGTLSLGLALAFFRRHYRWRHGL